jgi:hypothetical protein
MARELDSRAAQLAAAGAQAEAGAAVRLSLSLSLSLSHTHSLAVELLRWRKEACRETLTTQCAPPLPPYARTKHAGGRRRRRDGCRGNGCHRGGSSRRRPGSDGRATIISPGRHSRG